jgi:hypothetical protein
VKGYQARLYEGASCLLQGFFIHGHDVAYRCISVVTEALIVGHGHEEEVEGQAGRVALLDMLIPNQTLVHPAELGGDFPQAVWAQYPFCSHDCRSFLNRES